MSMGNVSCLPSLLPNDYECEGKGSWGLENAHHTENHAAHAERTDRFEYGQSEVEATEATPTRSPRG